MPSDRQLAPSVSNDPLPQGFFFKKLSFLVMIHLFISLWIASSVIATPPWLSRVPIGGEGKTTGTVGNGRFESGRNSIKRPLENPDHTDLKRIHLTNGN
jgi:hypothetical protein